MLKNILAIFVGLLFVGCYNSELTYANFTLFSNKKLPENVQVQTSGYVVGKSCLYLFPLFHFGASKKTFDEMAVQNAIEEGQKRGLKGNVLTDAKIYRKSGFYLLFGKVCAVAEGNLSTISAKK
ncbi:hypothetical protein [Helicobacter cetorum]|uniref:hypothetical protein n=1 Tax=Helicobacter cetorum TaxID=138563 RepID=UPI000CF17758|nr:hypothetical protein [Helicobacter cetorum]